MCYHIKNYAVFYATKYERGKRKREKRIVFGPESEPSSSTQITSGD